ncbi:MAG: phytanoyl-CoA dioxygenase family protein [Leisingera sp.]
MAEAGSLETDGRVWLHQVLQPETLEQLDRLYTGFGQAGERITALQPFNAPEIRQALSGLLPGVFATRAVAFDKSGGRNWSLPWHQDRVIAVKERPDTPIAKNWSCKCGAWHCEPPEAVLSNMLFVRLYLDDVSERSGGMQMALGSHKHGVLLKDDVRVLAEASVQETEHARRGDMLVMNMLLVHRSLPARSQQPRRVIRVDYANRALPKPLEWAVKN